MVFHTDNYLFHYENKALKERFPEKESKPLSINNESINYVKSIIRGSIKYANKFQIYSIKCYIQL